MQGAGVSEYVTKESLAQQGGYGLANKGPQHDEAWLISWTPSQPDSYFEDKAEALTTSDVADFFSLTACASYLERRRAGANRVDYRASRPPGAEHVQNYVDIFRAITGRTDIRTGEDLVAHV